MRLAEVEEECEEIGSCRYWMHDYLSSVYQAVYMRQEVAGTVVYPTLRMVEAWFHQILSIAQKQHHQNAHLAIILHKASPTLEMLDVPRLEHIIAF